MGDAVGSTLIGGPADDSTTTGALRLNDTRVGAIDTTVREFARAAHRVHRRGPGPTQTVNGTVERRRNQHTATFERTTISSTQRDAVDDAAEKLDKTTTNEREIKTSGQRRTRGDVQTYECAAGNVQTFIGGENGHRAATRDVRRRRRALKKYDVRTTIDATGLPLIGGPADGTAGCCGRGHRLQKFTFN